MRCLVICIGPPPPVPQFANFDSAGYLQFIRNMALMRKETTDLTQGWHDASFLMGSEWTYQYGPDWVANMNAPAPLDPDDPNQAGPGAHHHVFELPDGAQGIYQHDLQPLHMPDPGAAANMQHAIANMAWQQAFAAWLAAQGPEMQAYNLDQQQAYINAGFPVPQRPNVPPDVERQQPAGPAFPNPAANQRARGAQPIEPRVLGSSPHYLNALVLFCIMPQKRPTSY